MSSLPLTGAALVINGGGATFPKIGAAPFYAVAAGSLFTLAAGTALPSPAGVVPAGYFGIFSYFVNSAGVVTVAAGNPGVTLGVAGWPQSVVGAACIGILVVTNGAGFTGGTTALDAGTTVYLNPTCGFDATVLV
jgi:hypothetical protein